ncbi:MAG: DinB family protein [Ardenticatenaceae bacterium]|nr:DinB family protein [Ardenticatenaceae bacterium]
MLDFTPVRNKEITMADLTADLTPADLRTHTNEMVDTILTMIQDCTDAHVTFIPHDPDANDTYADSEADINLAWTLGHVIVHLNASCEESAALAAELARGVPYESRRSRSEIPWESVTTIEQCRRYLEQSRRICLASLDMWPDEPYLDNTFPARDGTPYNALVRYVFGLSHADSHLGQIANIIEQAKSN